MNNVSSAQFELQARKQHYRIMETQRISFLSGLIGAIAVPVILNAASLSWDPNRIAKDNGIVVLAEETAQPARKAQLNVDSNGVILKGIRRSCLLHPPSGRQRQPGHSDQFRGCDLLFRFRGRQSRIW
jgi:hypothetical protein